MKIAIKNIHNCPGDFHGYIYELARLGFISILFFDTPIPRKTLANTWKRKSFKSLGLDKARMTWSAEDLNACDVLLCFESLPKELNKTVKDFPGLKIFHTMDYFWNEPLSEKAKRLEDHGIDYVMCYGAVDIHDSYFKKYAPQYIGKVIPVPFGFAPRFKNTMEFSMRKPKCVAMGSVRPLTLEKEDPKNFVEEAAHFAGEKWFHKFRRMIIESKSELAHIVDSMLPEFPRYRDYDYDMVQKFNEYQMFVSDESIFYFPSAKAYEGPATGSVMVASDHQCFKDFGFEDKKNCVMHREFDIADMKFKIEQSLADRNKLEEISKAGEQFVRTRYSHPIIAAKLHKIIVSLYNKKIGPSLYQYANQVWQTSYEEIAAENRELPEYIKASQWVLFQFSGLCSLGFINIQRAWNKFRNAIKPKANAA